MVDVVCRPCCFVIVGVVVVAVVVVVVVVRIGVDCCCAYCSLCRRGR